MKGYHQFNGELALVRFSNARLFSTERHNKKIFGKLDSTQTGGFQMRKRSDRNGSAEYVFGSILLRLLCFGVHLATAIIVTL